MPEITTILSDAERHCRERGSRLTRKRKHVLSGLLSSQKAMSAYELVDYCKEHYDEKLPPMSVYRILDFLESEELVHRLSSANKYVACKHISCDHSHQSSQFLICRTCNNVSEIYVDKSILSSLRANVAAAGFQLNNQQLELSGSCQTCSDSGLSPTN